MLMDDWADFLGRPAAEIAPLTSTHGKRADAPA